MLMGTGAMERIGPCGGWSIGWLEIMGQNRLRIATRGGPDLVSKCELIGTK